MTRLLSLGLGLLLLVPSLLSLTTIRKGTPSPERLGYMPSFEVANFSSLEYRLLLSELFFYDTVFYYGSLLDNPGERPNYGMIAQYVNMATRLNPYNIDAYYFGQAQLTWDGGMVRQMNAMLKRGFKNRNWDFYLPFFIGFNYSYFLNDYDSAAEYMAEAARLNPQITYLPTLVGRLYYQANKTDQATQYLKVMYEGTRNEALRKEIRVRIEALEAISFLENAVKKFKTKKGRLPADISDLVKGNILKGIPPDPYGGEFYIDRGDGRVKTTSNLAFPRRANERH